MNGAMVGRGMSVLRASRAISSSLSEEKSPASNNIVTEHANINVIDSHGATLSAKRMTMPNKRVG